ncbi:MAG: MFS transporter [Bacteroidales bacterium]|nr:MFS transporter [Bacteroidales bacterium]
MKPERALRWAINTAALMVLLDLSAVNIALPEMRAHFNFSVSYVSLVLMISMLSASSSALIIGKISQLVHPKKMLFIGFSVYAITTFLSGVTTHFNTLLVLRFIQGFAEAALYVIGPALIKRYLKPENQAKAYGKWMMSTGIGISMGPLIGGYLIANFGWSAVFFINLPLAIAGLYFTFKMQVFPQKKQKEHFDIVGAIWSFSFLASLIAAVNWGKFTAQNTFFEYVLYLFSVLFLGLFIHREKNFSYPILQLSVFRSRNFWLASLGFFLFFVINVGSRFIRPFYFEEGRGFPSEISGWLMMVAPAVMVILSPITEIFQRYLGIKTTVLLGNLFLFVSMGMFSLWNQNSSIVFLILSMLVLGVSMGLFYPAATFIGMHSLSPSNYGMGSAAISTSKSLGKLAGVLLFAFLFSFFLSDTDTLLHNKSFDARMEAIQKVFLFATALSFIALIFSLFFQSKTKTSQE